MGSPNGTNRLYYGYRDTSTHVTDTTDYDATTYHTFTITRNGTTFTFNIDGTDRTATINWFDDYDEYVLGFLGWSTPAGSVYVKNVKFIVYEE